MARVGTAYVEIDADFGPLNRALAGRVQAIGDNITAKVKVDVDRAGLSRFGGSATGALGREIAKKIGPVEPEVKPDVDQGRLVLLRERIAASLSRIKVHLDVDRGALDRLGAGFGGIAAALGGLLGSIPGIGGLFRGLQSSFGTTAIGASAATAAILGLATVLAALVASLGAAVAGLGALAVAFAGALGPALLVTVGVFARFATILKAVKDHQNNAGTEARGLAGAQQQLQAATDAVSQAQANLREQTTAAYQAWADAIEKVKDDLLGVKDAQLGIDDANLSLREAKQELADFRKEAGAAGDAFGGVFKKFTDVDVDTSGLRAALQGAAGAAGTSLTGDQELKLERLILNVRRAKLGEKHATDALHDSTVKLARDRKVEADFARRGIAAYKPYTAATQQLSQAQRSLASAQRAQAGATERQSQAWDKLSPAERKFGALLIALGKTFSKVFTPVMSALLEGITRGLRSIASAAGDPRIQRSLVATGRAMGDAFASLAKTLTNPEMRRAFVQLAAAGVRIIRAFGTKVFEDLAKILVRLAVATLPLLIQFLDRVADWFDDLEHSSRNTRNLRDDVQHLVDVFNDWVTFIGRVSGALLDIGRVLEPIGTAVIRFLAHPLDTIKRKLDLTGRDLHDLGRIFSTLKDTAAAAIGGVLTIFQGFNTALGGIIRVIAGLLTGDFREAWDGVKGIFKGAIKTLKGLLELAISPFKLLGQRVGRAITGGIKAAFKGVVQFFENRINDLITLANVAIDGANKVSPFHDIGHIDHIGTQGQLDRHVGPKAPNPLNPGGGLGRLPSARTAAVPRLAAFAASGTSKVIGNVNFNVTAPAAALPDPDWVIDRASRALDRLG